VILRDSPTGFHSIDAARVRAALTTASYDVDSLSTLLGPVAHGALARGDLVPALRATTGGSPLETLVRLFLLGTTEPLDVVERALPPAAAGPLLHVAGDEVRAALDLRPYAADADHWWVVSDLGSDVRPGALQPDHVLGVGGASTTLAQAAVRVPVASALDVGTGCGVQSLHLSQHAGAVTATDRNPRALALARMTADLNGLAWELLEGSLYEPVAGRMFDLVVANPPFVVGPGRDDYAYRDSGLAGDAVTEALVGGAAGAVAPGGWCQLLGNWLHRRGEDWRERVTGWVPQGFDGWVLQREVQDPAEYVALWLRDAAEGGARRRARADEWLRWFDDEAVDAVGFGVITLRRNDSAAARVVAEEARQAVDQPIWPHLASWFDRQDWLRDADLLGARLRTPSELRLGQEAVASSVGWEVALQVLRLDGGLRWQGEVDQLGVEIVAMCDGSRGLGEILGVVAADNGYGTDELVTGALPAVRHLVERGFLLPSWP
jgi:methylase of polypeptide subunit release factors